MVRFQFCRNLAVFVWRRKVYVGLLLIAAVYVIIQQRHELNYRSLWQGGRGTQRIKAHDLAETKSPRVGQKWWSTRRRYSKLPRALRLIVTPAVNSTGGHRPLTGRSHSRVRPRVQTADCNMSRLSTDDRRVDDQFGSCRFPEVTTAPGFDKKINNLDPISLPLLSNYRNPCWYEALPKVNGYRESVHMFSGQIRQSFDRLRKLMTKRRQAKHFWRLRCLPLVYIIGMTASGKVDLHLTLLQNPYLIPAATQEPFYWSRDRWKWSSPISDYLDLFDEAAERIRNFSKPMASIGHHVAYHPMITVDGSVNYLYEFRGLKQVRGNDGKEPKHLIPDLIHNLTPNVDIKVILIVRNPTDWLFRAYCLNNPRKEVSPKTFHEMVVSQTNRLKACFKRESVKSCVYNNQVSTATDKIKVHAGIYHVYIRDWLAVFPNMKVIAWDNYRKRKKAIIADLLAYLGLDHGLVKTKITNAIKDDASADLSVNMWSRTRQLLDAFYKSHNLELARLLRDKTFAFDN